MACTLCKFTKTYPLCITNLTLGTVTNLNTDHFIYIKNLATGRIVRLAATSDGAGLLTVDVSNEELMHNEGYEIWATLQTVDKNQMEELTLSDSTADCLYIRGEDLHDTNGVLIVTATHVLELD